MLTYIISLIVIFLFYHLYWKRCSLPPGPVPLPFVGNALSLTDKNILKTLKKWKQKYGDIHTIWMGSSPLVLVNDSKTIFDTFVKDGSTYEDRPDFKLTNVFKNGYYGLGVNGDIWREHRRFSLKVLRDFGLGKNLMQEKILTEVSAVIDDIKSDLKNGKKIFALTDELDRSVGSIINLLMLGYRFDRSKIDEFNTVKCLATKCIEKFTNPIARILESNINLLKHIPPFKYKYEETVNEGKMFEEFFMKRINEHKKQIDFESDQEPIDFCEAFLRKQHELEKQGIKDHTFSDRQLYAVIFDLWVAGQETTSTTLAWFCVNLLNFPHIQEKVQEELHRVIGSDRLVTLDDKPNLPYTNAVIHELQRYTNLGPINAPRKVTKDIEINGYKIPKETSISYQTSSLFSDPRYFKNPENFDPERFLNEDGKLVVPPEFIPFGLGKRVCLGEGLAKMELYLFAANLFNQFKLIPENGIPPTTERREFGSTMPHKFNCEIVPLYYM